MQFSTLAVALFASTTLVSVSSKQLTAKFDFTGLEATVEVVQNDKFERNNAAVWNVQISKFKKNKLCPSGQLNWHVHQYPGKGIRDFDAVLSTSAAACGKDVTGGHYDPTFACGGASQNTAGEGVPLVDPPTCASDTDCVSVNGTCDQGTCISKGGVCAILRARDQVPDGNGKVKAAGYSCGKDNQSSCEIGDQSGKLGPLKAKRKRVQQFEDQWMTPIDNLEGKSMVLHCCYDDGQKNTDGSVKLNCGPRLACANLE